MAITVSSVASIADGSGTADNLSFSHTLNSGDDYVIVGLAYYGSFSGGGGSPSVDPPTATYGGTAMNFTIGGETGLYFGGGAYQWYLHSSDLPSPGSITVYIDFDDAASGAAAYAISFQGCQAQAPEASGLSTGSGASSSVNVTTISNNAIIVDCHMASFIGAVTPGSGQTEFVDTPNTGNINIFGSTKILASAGATTMSCTHSTTSYLAYSAVALAEAAATAEQIDALFHGINL